MNGTVVGIDLGTTHTVVSAVRDGQAAALAASSGEVLIPSVVSFHPSGNVLVGHEAKARRKIDAGNTIYSVKRLIGRSWNTAEVREARHRFPFEMREGPGQAALVVARNETYTLPEISAFVLRKAKALAEEALACEVARAVITVPANFNDLQRAATKVAGRVAGLEVMRILNEPTAAALAYGYGKGSSERIAVYDFGGGTLDVTLLDLSDNVFEVLATAGNTFLGGDDIDHAISERMADDLLATHRVDARADPRLSELLRAAAEDIKKQLSTAAQASVTLEEVAHFKGGRALDFAYTLSRAELNQLLSPLLDKTFDVCREALGVARMAAEDFDQVLLVGGSTRIPLVRQQVERFFKRVPVIDLNPDQVVAIGAAIQANALSGAAKRRSAVPLPPKPAGSPSAASVTTTDSSETHTEAEKAPGQGARARFPTAPGLQPRSSTALPALHPSAPLVVPPVGSQPHSGVPVTRDRAGKPSRTTTIGLGSAATRGTEQMPELQPKQADQASKTSARARQAREQATQPSAADAAQLALNASSAVQPQPHTTDAIAAKYGDLPLIMPPEPLADADSGIPDYLDDSELQELPGPLSDADDDEVTLSRAQPNAGAAFEDERPQPRKTSGERLPQPAMLAGVTAVLGGGERAPELPAPRAGAPELSNPSFELPTPTVPQPPAQTQQLASPAEQLPSALRLETPAPVIRDAAPAPPLLIDVTPLTLAVETVGGYCDTVIERNSPIPCEKTRQFATVLDDQDSVRVRVSQGEARIFAQNTLLGEVVLSGLRGAPRGGVTIEVSFALDASGMLSVNATDTHTGRSVSTRIRLVGLSDATQLEAMRARQGALSLA